MENILSSESFTPEEWTGIEISVKDGHLVLRYWKPDADIEQEAQLTLKASLDGRDAAVTVEFYDGDPTVTLFHGVGAGKAVRNEDEQHAESGLEIKKSYIKEKS